MFISKHYIYTKRKEGKALLHSKAALYIYKGRQHSSKAALPQGSITNSTSSTINTNSSTSRSSSSTNSSNSRSKQQQQH